MGNLIDYIEWRGDLIFKKSPINEVDLAIFTQVALLDLDRIVPGFGSKDSVSLERAKKRYFSKKYARKMNLGLIIPNTIIDMFYEMGLENRYRHLRLSNYVNIISIPDEEQISCLTIDINKDLKVVAFSGTDDTIIGWKENINMIYMDSIPSHKIAINYLEEMASIDDKEIIVCGHSKGGNMALFAGTHVNEKTYHKIRSIVNFDGPGVSLAVASGLTFTSRIEKVMEILPESSVVGRLFIHKENRKVVLSSEKGLYQHDVLSWEVKQNAFVATNNCSEASDSIDLSIKEIVNNMSEKEKIQFSSLFYRVLSNNKILTLTDILGKKREILANYFTLTKEERLYLGGPIKLVLKNKYLQKFILDSAVDYKKYKKNSKYGEDDEVSSQTITTQE